MLSVILATHNGEETLPRTLAALCKVRRPGPVEVIAVDNASTDRTPDILKRYEQPLGLRILTEPRQGKSYALNRAIAAANGDLIVFTDDDVLPDEGWLEAYVAAAEAHPEAALFGGQVRHAWDAPPPDWLKDLAAGGLAYSGTSLDLEEGPIPFYEVKGPNFMVRTQAIGKVRYCEEEAVNFSGQGGSLGGEDVMFARDILAQGCTSWFVPQACLRHIVRKKQIGIGPLFSRDIRIGGVQAQRESNYIDSNAPRLFGYPRRELGAGMMLALGGAHRLVRGQLPVAARRMVALGRLLGRLKEWRRITR